MISKSRPKNLSKAEIVDIKKGMPLQYIGGKYLVDLKETRWKSFFIVSLFKTVVRKFEIMNEFELNRALDYLLMSTSTHEEVVKEINSHIGKYVTFFYGSGQKIINSSDIVTNDNINSVSSLGNNLKKVAK
jgi:hypothetical protein